MKFLIVIFTALSSLLWSSFQKEEVSEINYYLDPENSIIEWSGSSPKVTHRGAFTVTCKELEVVDGHIKSGSFVIPIASIKNFDLPKVIKPILINHLKSKDFFHINFYPEATFTLTQVEPLPGINANEANAMVTGNFTMLGQTKPLNFPARIDLLENKLKVDARFTLNRTHWGMHYAADSTLENRYILPEVGIHLKLIGSKNEI